MTQKEKSTYLKSRAACNARLEVTSNPYLLSYENNWLLKTYEQSYKQSTKPSEGT